METTQTHTKNTSCLMMLLLIVDGYFWVSARKWGTSRYTYRRLTTDKLIPQPNKCWCLVFGMYEYTCASSFRCFVVVVIVGESFWILLFISRFCSFTLNEFIILHSLSIVHLRHLIKINSHPQIKTIVSPDIDNLHG